MFAVVGGDVTGDTVDTTGAGLPAIPTVGDNVIVGTAAAELTPRLLISVDPSGIPGRATPPGTVGEVGVGVDDEAILLEPEPHIPDKPDVSGVPELVDIPDVADPDEVDVVPDVAMVADIGVPPPSKVAVDPNISVGEVPTVEHAVPLLDIAVVPVEEEGIGLTPGVAISVAPIGIPVVPTVPEPLSSGEVMPSEGVAVIVPT